MFPVTLLILSSEDLLCKNEPVKVSYTKPEVKKRSSENLLFFHGLFETGYRDRKDKDPGRHTVKPEDSLKRPINLSRGSHDRTFGLVLPQFFPSDKQLSGWLLK